MFRFCLIVKQVISLNERLAYRFTPRAIKCRETEMSLSFWAHISVLFISFAELDMSCLSNCLTHYTAETEYLW